MQFLFVIIVFNVSQRGSISIFIHKESFAFVPVLFWLQGEPGEEGVSGAQGQNGAKVIKAALITLPLTQVKSLYRWTQNLLGSGFLKGFKIQLIISLTCSVEINTPYLRLRLLDPRFIRGTAINGKKRLDTFFFSADIHRFVSHREPKVTLALRALEASRDFP